MAGCAKDRWIAVRALHEGAPATVETLAAVAGCSPRTVARHAEREGWLGPEDIAVLPERSVRLNMLVDRLIDEIESIGSDTVDRWDKTRIETVSALMRTLEKVGEITRSGQSAKENQTRRDAEMADVLRRIDRRIIELATGFAERLVAAKSEQPRGEAG